MIYITYRKKKKKKESKAGIWSTARGAPVARYFGHLVDLLQEGKKDRVPPGVLVYPRWPEKKEKEAPETNASSDTRRGWRAGMAPARERRQRKRKKERKRREKGEKTGRERLLPSPASGQEGPPMSGRARGRDPRAARPNHRPPRHLHRDTPHRLGQGRERGGREAEHGRAEGPPPRREERKSGRGHTPSSGDGGDAYVVGAGARETPPPTTPPDARVRAGAGGRRVPARPAETNPCVEG